jgi:excisionase family DNA binding protein
MIVPTTAFHEEMLTTAAAAGLLGVSPTTLAIWRSVGRHDLPYCKVGRLVRYRRSDLDAWVARRTRTRSA